MAKKTSLIEQTIRLLDILQESNYSYKTKDLQKELGVSDRQIRNYISVLRKCGVDIKSDSSANGGYFCKESYFRIPYLITKKEMEALTVAKVFFEQNNVLEDLGDFRRLYYKIKQQKEYVNHSNLPSVSYKYLEKQKEESIEQKDCRKNLLVAIEKFQKVQILYGGNYDEKKSVRIIHPYSFTLYKNAYYIEAYCEKAKDHRSFKVARIGDYTILKETFKQQKSLLKKLEKEGQGIYREKDYTLKAIFQKPFNKYVEEMVIGQDKKTEKLSDTHTLVTVNLNNWTETLTWLQGFSHHVEVLEPKEMRQEIIENMKKNIKIYETRGKNSSDPMK